MCGHEYPGALMSMVLWCHECSWVLMSAHSLIAPCSWLLFCSHGCSLFHDTKFMASHEWCWWALMSDHEQPLALMSTHKQHGPRLEILQTEVWVEVTTCLDGWVDKTKIMQSQLQTEVGVEVWAELGNKTWFGLIELRVELLYQSCKKPFSTKKCLIYTEFCHNVTHEI